jgi:hypothetical protein
MPGGPFLPNLEDFANRDPLLYETLTQLQQAIPTVPPPQVMSGVNDPTNNLVASPNTVFYQTDNTGAVTAKFLKTSGTDATGWVSIP